MRRLAMLLCLVPAVAAGQAPLERGSVLVYATPDGNQREWVVDSVAHGIALGGRSGCSLVRFAAGGPATGPDQRITCVAGDTLFRWVATAQEWRASRPIGPRSTLVVAGTSTRSRYVTGDAGSERISGEEVAVLPTTVETLDSTGTVIRRLTERYAPVLGTATWGRFEVRDSAAPGGWRVSQEFRLAAIRRGVPR